MTNEGIEPLLKRTAWELARVHLNTVIDDLERQNVPTRIVVYSPNDATLNTLRTFANELMAQFATSEVALAVEKGDVNAYRKARRAERKMSHTSSKKARVR